jgi:U3 small nucleolar RNA-associated protein 19
VHIMKTAQLHSLTRNCSECCGHQIRVCFTGPRICAGGMTGMLALNGLFILVTRHGLEYPAFFRRLYGLLTLDAFQVRE